MPEAEVYETPDIPPSSSVLRDLRQPDVPEDSEIDGASVSSQELFQRFADKKLDTSSQSKFMFRKLEM